MKADTSIKKIVLKNGLRILVDSMPHAHSVSTAITLNGGSRDETLDTIGITHLLEHVIFKRTKAKNTQDIAQAIDDLGGDVNAFTDSDGMCLFASTTSEKFLGVCELFRELLLEENFSEQDLEMEKSVIRQEIIEASDDPTDALYQSFSEEFWRGSMLALPVFGYLKTVETFTSADVRKRLSELLCGKRILVSVAGNVDVDLVVTEIERCFAFLPEGSPPKADSVRCSSGIVSVPKPVNQIYFTLGIPWPSVSHDDYLSGEIISTLLGETMSSRLFQAVREDLGLAYDIDSEVDAHKDTAGLLINATLERANVERALEVVLAQLDKLAQHRISEEEFRRALGILIDTEVTSADSVSGRMWRALETEQYFGEYVSIQESVNKLKEITLDDIHRVIGGWLVSGRGMFAYGGDVEGLLLSDKIKSFCPVQQ